MNTIVDTQITRHLLVQDLMRKAMEEAKGLRCAAFRRLVETAPDNCPLYGAHEVDAWENEAEMDFLLYDGRLRTVYLDGPDAGLWDDRAERR